MFDTLLCYVRWRDVFVFIRWLCSVFTAQTRPLHSVLQHRHTHTGFQGRHWHLETDATHTTLTHNTHYLNLMRHTYSSSVCLWVCMCNLHVCVYECMCNLHVCVWVCICNSHNWAVNVHLVNIRGVTGAQSHVKGGVKLAHTKPVRRAIWGGYKVCARACIYLING